MIGLMALMLFSCGDDDTDDTPPPAVANNSITIGGESFDLATGTLTSFGQNPEGVNNYYVILLSASQEEGLLLDIYSTSSDGITPGDYSFSRSQEAFTIYGCEAATSLDINAGLGNITELNEGTVEVMRDGSDYVIAFDLRNSSGDLVVGKYAGTLDIPTIDLEEGTGSFTLEGITGNFETPYALVEDYGSNENGSYDIDVTLINNTNYLLQSGTIEDFNSIYLDLNSDTEGLLADGTYTFGPDRDKFTMVNGAVTADLTVDLSTGEVKAGLLYVVIDGSVTVSSSGNTFTLSYSLTALDQASDSTVITGTYTGILNEF